MSTQLDALSDSSSPLLADPSVVSLIQLATARLCGIHIDRVLQIATAIQDLDGAAAAAPVAVVAEAIQYERFDGIEAFVSADVLDEGHAIAISRASSVLQTWRSMQL